MQPHEFTLKETLRGFPLEFKTTYDIFSYKRLDEGTRLLIDALEIAEGDVCLDLGCGYGPIGIVMAKLSKTGKVYLADRDFVAIEYSKINCELNNATNYEAVLTNGFIHIPDIEFDVIVSNLPSHIAQEALTRIIADSKSKLKKGGKFYIGSVSRIRPYMQRQLEAVYGNYTKIAENKMYSVSLAENV